MRRGQPSTIRFSDAQQQAIERLAKRDRRTESDIVRQLVIQAARQRGSDLRELLDAEEHAR